MSHFTESVFHRFFHYFSGACDKFYSLNLFRSIFFTQDDDTCPQHDNPYLNTMNICIFNIFSLLNYSRILVIYARIAFFVFGAMTNYIFV